MNVNECELKFIYGTKQERERKISIIYGTIASEFHELEESNNLREEELKTSFGIFYQYIRSSLCNHGRQGPSTAPKFWQDTNTNSTIISPVPFNNVANACLSSQAS